MSETIYQIFSKINKLINDLKNRGCVLADTRISKVSLYDHLILIAGIMVAMVKELMMRGKPSEEVWEKIAGEDLIRFIGSASILHGWGKDSRRG
ncbi:MAG: hypothetical protein WED07_12755 [Candidatus Freyarchaeum deiterrae]